MGQHHRKDGGTGPRFSRGLVFGALAVVLVAAIIVSWQHLGDSISRQGDDAARNCVEGEQLVPIIASPEIADALIAIAEDYNAGRPVVRDRCVEVAVRPGDSRVTLDGLLAPEWDPAAMGEHPAAWVPQSSIWSAELSTADAALVQGTPSSLVTSPVVLATSPELRDAFDGQLSWQQVPTLQERNMSLTAVGLRGIGSLRMAMPIGASSDATALSAQAVAASLTRTAGLLTAVDAESPQVSSTIAAMLDGAPLSPDGTSTGAATVIAEASSLADAEIRAVPITEQQLYQLTRDDHTARLAEVIPQGPTPIADYPVIRLSGPKVTDAAGDAVTDFFAFAAGPEQLEKLTSLGFRGDAPLPTPTATVDFPTLRDPMPTPENSAAVTINELVYGG